MGWHALLQGIFLTQDQTGVFCVSCIAGRFFTTEPPGTSYTHLHILTKITLEKGHSLVALYSHCQGPSLTPGQGSSGLPGRCSGKESICSAGDTRDTGSIPGSGRSPESSIGESMATHSSSLAWRIPWTEEPGGLWGHKESDMTEMTEHARMKGTEIL